MALYLGTIVLTYGLSMHLYRSSWPEAAALWLAVPMVLVTPYTTATLNDMVRYLFFHSLTHAPLAP